MGEEEADPVLELAMEYAGALSTIVFDESCRLRDLTEAQVGRNQFAMDVAMDRLDGEADHVAERIGLLEDKMADVEQGLGGLLELGQEQTETSTWMAQGLGQLATCVLTQQNKIRAMEERMDVMREMILGLEHTVANPIVVDKEEMAVVEESEEEVEIEENEVMVPIPVLSGHGIFESFIFDQFHTPFGYTSPFSLLMFPLTTFMTSRLTNNGGFVIGNAD